MLKTILSATAVCAVCVATAAAQGPAAPLSFDVASVKEAVIPTPAQIASGKIHAGMKIDDAHVDIGLMAMLQLIQKAYDLKQYQIQGPDWMLTTPYDIVAKLPPGGKKEQVPQMLQTLLAERFKMKYHTEKKEHSVYALVQAKGGSKMAPYKPPVDSEGNSAVVGSNEVSISGAGVGGKGNTQTISDGTGMQQTVTPSPDGKSLHIEATKISMAQLCDGLFRFVGRPIVDMTDLKGDWIVTLDISLAEVMAMQKALGVTQGGPQGGGGGGADARPADAADANFGASVVESLTKMGLKLESRKAPLEVMVIDHIEKVPTEN
jgi:uncharacterized protein (TIGR03435 family)